MLRMSIGTLRERTVQTSHLLIASAFALSGILPIILSSQANAATLSSRKITLSTSKASASATHTFDFNIATTGNVGSIQFLYCTEPLGTCTAPAGLNAATATLGTNTINAAAAGFAMGTAGNAPTANQVRIDRTPASATAGQAVVVNLNTITNPSAGATASDDDFYVRINTYSDAYTTAVDDGTVAASTTDELTVTGRVQERLLFCVFALDDAAGSSATVGAAATNMPQDCLAAEANVSTNVDIGIISNSSTSRAPVDNSVTEKGNDKFGAAMINTNASNGVALTYFSSLAGSGTNELRAFRVAGATCNVSGTSVVDQCFVSAAAAGEAIVTGTERFGMQIACVANSTTNTVGTTSNLGKNGSGVYTSGSGSLGSYNSAYDGGRTADMDDNASDNCENDNVLLSTEHAWNTTGTAVPLISSTTVVDDEMVKMRYAATANATTPTGTYTVQSTYIATPTF